MTVLKYLTDTYHFQDEGIIAGYGSDDKGDYILFDQTIFYPQGGGQPADTGYIDIGGNKHDITFVRMIDGKVRHYGAFSDGAGLEGQNAKQVINEERRRLNSRLHSAGHLIHLVSEEISDQIQAVKGYHFGEGSYVEFKGELDIEKEDFISKAEDLLTKYINDNLTITGEMMSKAEIEAARPDLPYPLPEGKPLRVVRIEGDQPVPCGGTHVPSMQDLKSVKIRKIKAKKGIVKISYELA